MEKTDFTPKVTVSLCTYNSNNEWLHTAVESILNQTFVDFELLIIDDGSKDKPDFSADIFKDPRIEIVCKEKNEGLAASRNLAIKLSKGKYIAMMDDDDISLPTRLEKQFEYLEKHEDVVVLGTWFENFGEKTGIFRREINDNEYYRCCLLFGNAPTIIHPSTMIRKSAFIDNGILYDPRIRKGQDYNLWSKLSDVGICTNYPEVLFKYRVHSDQISNRLRSFDVGDYEWMTVSALLSRLGIELTAEEVDFVRKNHTRKDVDAVRYRKWLDRLLDANQKTGIYEPSALKRRIDKQWESKVLNVKVLSDFIALYKASDKAGKKIIRDIEKKRLKRIIQKLVKRNQNG